MKVATDIMFMQMSAKSGIKKFVEKAVTTMVKEYRHMDKGPMEENPVVTPIDPETLFYKENSKALEAINLIE